MSIIKQQQETETMLAVLRGQKGWTEMAKKRGKGHWGHKGRPGKRGGSAKGRDGLTAAGVAAARKARETRAKPGPPAKKGEQYTQARVDKTINDKLRRSLVVDDLAPKDAKHLEYKALKNSVTIRDIGGHFGNISTHLTKNDLSWDKLTVSQVTDFLDRHGAGKYKATRRKKGRGSYVHYD